MIVRDEKSEKRQFLIEWKKCQVDEIDFEGSEVIVGVDMSKSTDLCGVSIISKDKNSGIIKVKSKAFLPVEMIQTAEMYQQSLACDTEYSGHLSDLKQTVIVFFHFYLAEAKSAKAVLPNAAAEFLNRIHQFLQKNG